jgi:hypothetical protein
VNPGDWDNHYKKHVDALLGCAKRKGAADPNLKGDKCREMKPQVGGCCVEATGVCTNDITRSRCESTGDKYLGDGVKCTAVNCPPPSVGEVASAAPAVGPGPGVHLYADTNDDGVWDHDVVASSPFQPGFEPDPPISISPGTPLTIAWSADGDHLNCRIAATFPAGVEVNSEEDESGAWTGTGSNWLLGESPQTIGVLEVPGYYYFHIDCDDDDYRLITAPLTFYIPGQSPTVLHVQAIVQGVPTTAFDYPSPGRPHVDVPAGPTSDVVIAWTASNVQPVSCTLEETFDPPGPTPQMFADESGFETVTPYPMTDQNYMLTCMGQDGQPHSVDVTLQVSSLPPTPTATCTSGGGGDCRTRALSFTMVPPAAASGGATASAIKVTLVDLENSVPPNNNPAGPCCPPANFTTFDTAVNAVCAGGNDQGYRCPPSACPGGSCPAGVGCTEAAGANAQGSCARWVGPPLGYLESNDNPGIGNYRVSRLQCAPFYYDWTTEPFDGLVNVIGAEIVPSSTYTLQSYGSDCKGNEGSCINVSVPVNLTTRRAGDIAAPFQAPGPPLTQPNAVDVANAVNKFRNLAGAPSKVIAQVQPNFPDPNSDFNAIDVVTVVDNVRGFGYTYSGPCVCPSTVPCNVTACAGASACIGPYGAGATCIKTCTSGRTGQPCNNNLNCGYCVGGPLTGNGAAGIPCDANSDCASGTCQTGTCPTGAMPGFCRDRCGRCN